jgi:hypothetical protein
MERQEYLNKIVNKCRKLLQLAEDWKGKSKQAKTVNGEIFYVFGDVTLSYKETVALECELSKAGWRSVLIALDWADGMTPQVREAIEKEIIAAWPQELLSI